MSRTLTSTYTTLVSVTSSSDNPVTVATTAVLQNGLYGQNGHGPITDWTITNYGTINAGSYHYGITLFDGGTITNQSSGTISGDTGILVSAEPGTVVNAGGIYGTVHGVALVSGGSVTNQSGGTISANNNVAVEIADASGTVVNYGDISSTAGSVSEGVNLDGGGSVTNQSGGTITAYYRGVYVAALGLGAVTVVNAGYIAATGTASRNDGDAVFLGYFTAGGSVTNQSGGTISGHSNGVYSKYDAATVVNAGYIQGFSGSGNGIALEAGGSVTNQSGGTISGFYGIYGGSNAAITVVNAGSITGSSYGSGIALQAGGSVTNQSGGTISSYNAGIYGGTIAAVTVVNAGYISAYESSGIGLEAGGSVTNQSGGTISGYSGVYISGAAGTVVNNGSITAASGRHSRGITLEAGGSVTNQSGGTISGRSAVVISGAAGTVVNSGSIAPSGAGFGIDLEAGGSVTNQSGGTISSIYGGTTAAVTVVNAGYINDDRSSYGIGLEAGGSVTNLSGGTISGEYAVDIFGATGTITNQSGGTISGFYGIHSGTSATVTVVNAGYIGVYGSYGIQLKGGGSVTNQSGGTISGRTDALQVKAGYAARLAIDPGAVFVGTVNGGNTIGGAAVSTLELASGASVGTLTGLGSRYINFAATTIDAGARWTLTGGNSLAAGTTLTNAGTLTLSGATFSDAGVLVNNGGIVLDPSTMTVASLTGTGTVTIEASSTLVVTGAIASTETIQFAGSGAYLDLQSPLNAAGSVIDFTQGESIDLSGIAPGTVSYSGGELLFDGSDAFPLALASGSTLQIGASGDGTELTAQLCFCIDTMIQTPSGRVRVQDLAVGDLVMTLSGVARPIAWIGTGAVLATRGRRNAATPVIVRKGALADNVPTHDLRVTKGHALYLDGALIPVEYLVNHSSIEWDDRAQEVTLYHIELNTHDVLIANGAPAESYRDDGNRWLFRNANSGWDLPPQEPFAPILTGGPIVDAAWQRLAARAGVRPVLPLTEDADLHLLVDGVRVNAIRYADETHVFRLAQPPAEVRIVSRAAAAQELGAARDPRVLGVAVRRIVMREGRRLRMIEAADAALDRGFHLFEPDNGFRWTDGDAVVPAALFADVHGVCEVELRVGCTARYVADAAAA